MKQKTKAFIALSVMTLAPSLVMLYGLVLGYTFTFEQGSGAFLLVCLFAIGALLISMMEDK